MNNPESLKMPCQPNRGPVCSATFQPNSDNLPATDCLPRKDSWRWQTSNSEYGKFYVFVNREVAIAASKSVKLADSDCSAKIGSINSLIPVSSSTISVLNVQHKKCALRLSCLLVTRLLFEVMLLSYFHFLEL